ncbi:MAG: Gfo/Idh/MocA family oxidoreductase [Candidatus Omnitrophica bacterium]|nr:Gfo/Idh/MocA family oxidoreductase [Candidatus Omnitrophota bacterium]MCM8768328.1 Gfo/Idh/MocA family oxidoreductase [Candidatus Omnitrophota bacterium]
MKVKVALIGAGTMANTVHYPCLKEFPEVELVGLCDLVEEKLKATAKKFSIPRTYTDYRKMLQETEPEAVYILMPPYHLFDLVIDCLERGLHVFMEKPPGVTREQTRQMALLAERKGCLTMTGFQRRFAPLVRLAKERIAQKGPILQCQANFFKQTLGAGPYYRGAIDILTCDAIHAVDILRFLGGEVKKVASCVRSLYADYDNSFNALMIFESGSVGFLSTNWVSGKRIFSVEMHGPGIVAFVDPEKQAIIYQDNHEQGTVVSAQEAAGSSEIYKVGGFFAENRHFIDCLLKKQLPETHLGDAVKTMELVEAIYRHSL